MSPTEGKPKRGRGRPRKVKVVEPDAVILPAIRRNPSELPLVMQTCDVHPTVTYRIGGFCERCYGDQTMVAAKKIDDMLIEKVVNDLATQVDKVLDTGDMAVLERFLGRIMARFSRPQEHVVGGIVKHVHFSGPIDFGARR